MIINGLGKINPPGVAIPKELLNASPEEVRQWMEEEKKKQAVKPSDPKNPYPTMDTRPNKLPVNLPSKP